MLLSELMKKAGIEVLSCGSDTDPLIQGIAYDSRIVKKGDLFISIPGLKVNGDQFIEKAVEAGAVAVFSENPQSGIGVPWFQIKNTRLSLGRLAESFWDIDQNSLVNVGITGTNGKTTTSYFYKHLMDQLVGSSVSWMFGTVESYLGETVLDSTHTTPESINVFRQIGTASKPPRSIVMEVSSHALSLSRVSGMKYDIAVWTNLTQDHLDFHGTMEEYYKAKKLLFTDYLKKNGTAIVNIDDQWGKRLNQELSGAVKIVTYGKSKNADVRVTDSKCDWSGCSVELEYKSENFKFHSPLKGHFNVYNMVAMVAGAFALSIDSQKVQSAFSSLNRVPGRMDKVPVDAPFVAIVDYAHTPDALVNVLRAARSLTSGELICVFGCGGDRDKSKRPIMAQAVTSNCDEAIVTSDNPRSEKPDSIIAHIVKGVPLDFPHLVISDRREAIECAIKRAKAGDCIVIAGKGHEEYQEVNGVRHHFSDIETVQEIFEKLDKNNTGDK
ncbi:UDP-N-acetylmuramoylalanyl-D-glutamate--2, 6-diaminopimelate ligase [Chitinispirillum alkaliphilum]|nr:UDP-N-acetylmuramoylalanyl-D-glutamate--2, 6-diaminopimelate ligase [Chitinispirillum alkaliphilum]